MVKRLPLIKVPIFFIIIFSLIAASFLPSEPARKYIYQAIWFKGLWFIAAIGIILNIVSLLKGKDFRLAAIYLGFFLVLSGGFLSSLLEKEGFVEMKKGETANGFWMEDKLFQPLDFSLSLRDFSVEYYPEIKGKARFVKSYKSQVTVRRAGDILKEGVIEVNKPLSFGGFNFYQYGHDVDLPGQTILQVVGDPGLPCVYSGYFVLLAGMLISFRRIWKTIL